MKSPNWKPALAALVAVFFAGCATTPTPTAPVSVVPGVTARPVATQQAPAAPKGAPPAPVRATPANDPVPVPGEKSIPNLAPATPTTAVVPLKSATIVGYEESSTMLDNLTVFVVSVDGFRLSAGRSGWNTPISIKPGLRRIGVEFNRGKFAARAELMLTAKPEAAYQLKFATDAQLFGKNSFCEFWIEETANGDKALMPVRASLVRLDPVR